MGTGENLREAWPAGHCFTPLACAMRGLSYTVHFDTQTLQKIFLLFLRGIVFNINAGVWGECITGSDGNLGWPVK